MHTILTPTNRFQKPAYLAFDNLDDRREIRELLARLSPIRRVRFVQAFCRKARLGPVKWDLEPRVSAKTVALAERAMTDNGADERLTLELYQDVWMMASCYSLSLDEAFRELVQWVR